MKKIILFFILLIPFNVYAYSNYVYAPGNSIGIKIENKGLLVIGFYLKNNNDIKIGDYITKVNNIEVNSTNDLINLIDKYKNNNEINLTILRNNKEKNINFKLIKDKNIYKTGLYVKDSINGIGTLTYIDPESKIYGSLGHIINESNTNQKIEIKTGNIYNTNITNITRSENGIPGSKNANIDNQIIGNIKSNTNYGIFGNYLESNDDIIYEVGNPNNLKNGKAYIKTEIKENEIKLYEINITKINKNHENKNILFKITDTDLLNNTGGIIQGMSGSPIIQDNKLYGAVTHVVTDNVKMGYGIFITTMLNEGDKIK